MELTQRQRTKVPVPNWKARVCKVTIALPIKGTKKEPHICFHFEGIARGLERITNLPVDIHYGFPTEEDIPEIALDQPNFLHPIRK